MYLLLSYFEHDRMMLVQVFAAAVEDLYRRFLPVSTPMVHECKAIDMSMAQWRRHVGISAESKSRNMPSSKKELVYDFHYSSWL
jgi:hypothetical protein